MSESEYDHPPCCEACDGKGGTISGPCSDCLGTGHPHLPETTPTTEGRHDMIEKDRRH